MYSIILLIILLLMVLAAAIIYYPCAIIISTGAVHIWHCTVVPDCTLHSTITHVILVLEWWMPTHDCAIGIHVSLRRSHTFITWVIAECNVQSGLKTLKRLYKHCMYILCRWPWSLIGKSEQSVIDQACFASWICTLYIYSCCIFSWVCYIVNWNEIWAI